MNFKRFLRFIIPTTVAIAVLVLSTTMQEWSIPAAKSQLLSIAIVRAICLQVDYAYRQGSAD